MKNISTKSIILNTLLILITANSFAQTTWPCAQYITRQVPNGSAYRTNISYVYDLGVTPVTVTVAKTDTLLNASVIYNGNIWAWKQYTSTAQSGSAGARLIKVNYNGLDSTVTPTLTGYSFPTITMGCNAAFVDPNGIYYVINTANNGDGNFVLSRIDLTTATPTLLSNLTVNLQGGNKVGSGGLGDLVYRNDSVFALVNNVGLFRFALPSTSTTSVNTNLVGSTINRTIGSLFAINTDLNNIYGYGSANGATTQDRLLKISTQTGVVTELTLSGISVSQSDGAGCPSTDFSPPVFLNISGKVFDDANGLKGSPANTIDGTGTNAGGALYAQLLDGTNAVEATIPVASNGTYTFTGLTPGSYTVLINNSATASTSTTLPSNWVNTGEFNALIAGSAGNDGNVNGKSATVTLTLLNVANVNFGIEQLPTANNVTATSQSNPGGTIKVTVPTLNGSDPEQGILAGTGNLDTVIINTLPSNGTLYYNNVAVAAGDTIKNYNPSLLTVDPNSGAITVSFTYSEVDAAIKSSSTATVSMPFTTISVSGTIYDDGNGLTDNKVNGTGTNATSLNAVLIDAGTGKALATTAVAAAGTYSFTGLDAGNYSVEITTATATVGTTAPAVTLPGAWFSIGENLGAGTGNDGTVNGILSIGAVSTNTTNANFGIEQPPVANAVTASSQPNPGGINKVTVPTLNGSDPEQGTLAGTGNLDTVIINTLPSNGTLYYNNAAAAAGDTIKNYNPSLLTVDPNSGAITVSFTYSEVDAALKSSSTATVSMPFTTISVSGNVYDDGNGLTDNKVNGTGTNAGSLNALLIDAGNGKALATTIVAADGTYSFTGLDAGNYNVEITTSTATVGTTAPAVILPGTWFSTGENLGAGVGNDGTVNSILSLGAVSTNTTNANFGIEQPPVANTVTAISQLNPGGTNKVTVPTLNGSDPEQGTFAGVGNLDSIIINSLPANGTLYYNNVAVSAGDTIKNYNPSLLTVDPNSGAITVSFTYSEIDATLKSSSAATVTMPFTTINVSGTIYDDANGLTDNTVNGTGTNTGNLNAILINSTTGKVTAVITVAADGTYSFNSLDAGNYNIEITTNTATVGTTAPAVLLPGTWFSTGENLGAGSGNDGTINGSLSLGTISTNTTNANFGIEQPPVANTVTASSQLNPGGINKVIVPTLNGADPEQGILAGTGNLDTVIINTLPSNGTLYYNNVAVAAGDTIKNYNPSLLTVDPNSGAITVSFTYSEVDATLKSSSTATVSMPFTTISISGTIYDDANGLTDNTVNGTGTNAGSLNAVLINSTTGKVVAATTVAADGTYSFNSLDAGNYNVEVTTTAATVGNTAPGVALSTNWVSTGENLGSGIGNDGTINSLLSLGAVSTNTTTANFGIEQLPTANNADSIYNNPGGTNTVQAPTLNGADPEQGTYPGTSNADTVIIKSLPVLGTLYYNGTPVTAGDTIKNYNPTLLTFDPLDGSGTYFFTYTEIDGAIQSSTPAMVTMDFNSISIAGNVFDDANGLTDNSVNGNGTNVGSINAILIDAASGKVVATKAVHADGVYSFGGLNGGNYTIEISTNTATVGNTPPSVILPTGWVNTGENFGTGSGNDGIINGILSLGAISNNTTNVNFGIEQLPAANAVTATSQLNPGGTNKVTVPTLNGSDPEQGILTGSGNLDTVIINTLPSNGTLYYNNVAVSAGDTIKNYNPSLLTIDPNSGTITVSFTYSEADAALGVSNPATVSMPFTTINISGGIFDDANGLMDNTVNGTGTNLGVLNAILVDAGTGNVVAVTAAAVDGTYSFAAVDAGNYNVEITNTFASIGSPAPAVVLPSGWISTGENLGAGIGNDGTINGVLSLGAVSTNTINADFGIEQLPISDNKTYTIVAPAMNSSMTLNATNGTLPGPLSGSDPEDGIMGSNNTVVITTVPANLELYYDGTLVTNNTTIASYDPSKFQMKFTVKGILNTSFQYAFVDAAGNRGAIATYFISWALPLPVVLKSFNAEKENDYAVLNWVTTSELNVKAFNIERSTDFGKTWQSIGEVIATGTSSTTQRYSFTDANPESGTNLYRLQVEDNDGSVTYSSTSQVEIQDESSMKVFPNPVGQQEALNIQLMGLKAGSYEISMISASGQTIKHMTFNISSSGAATLVIPTGNTARGTYVILVKGDNYQISKTVVVANR